MKILLIGGTGALGRSLQSILLQNPDNEIYITTRIKRESHAKKLYYIVGNAKERTFFKKIISDKWDVIIDFLIYNTIEFLDRYECLLNATKQYIFFSSARVFADSEYPLTEDSPRLLDISKDITYLNTDEYALTKARQENILSNSLKRNWTIIRPYITFDPYRLQLGVMEKETWLSRAINNRTIVFSDDIINHRTTMTYSGDVANGVSAIIGNTDAFSESFNISSSESHTWKEILNIYIAELNASLDRKIKIKMVDLCPFYERLKYQVIYDRYYDRTFDNSKIIKFVGKKFFSKQLSSLAESLRLFLKSPKFLSIDWRQDVILDRIAKDVPNFNHLSKRSEKILYFNYRYLPKCLVIMLEKLLYYI